MNYFYFLFLIILIFFIVMKPISLNQHNSIISLSKSGLSEKQVAKCLHLSRGTVSKYRKLFAANNIISKSGRPAILTDAKKRQIKCYILSGKFKTAAEIDRSLVQEGYKLSYPTVIRPLRLLGFVARIKKKKSFLSTTNKALRLKWAKEHMSRTVEDWQRVISDETKINVWGSDGVKYCWIKPGDPLQPRHLDLTINNGSGSLMMWGCITYKCVGYDCHIQETIDAQLYCHILETSFKDTLDYWNYSVNNVILQQDNDPKHTAKDTLQYLERNGIDVLPWPSRSPDLNPIEHIWHYIKILLSSYERKASSIHELWERVDQE